MRVRRKLLTPARLLMLLLTLSSLLQLCQATYCEVLGPAATQSFDNSVRADNLRGNQHILKFRKKSFNGKSEDSSSTDEENDESGEDLVYATSITLQLAWT